jgi:pimeloyl-ACP methyl ester carboxylesterase
MPNSEMIRSERAVEGYTLILPGVFGNYTPHSKLTQGLIDADVPTAVEVDDWTLGPWGMPVNLTVGYRTRCQAERVADKIVAYQVKHPGCPVYLFGHSGGAYAAVLALEALPEDRRVTRAFLFGAPISPEYDLSVALSRTEQGIHNFYSTEDTTILKVATSLAGTMDKSWGPSAGAVGFRTPPDVDAATQWAYQTKLVQHPYTDDMRSSGHQGGHYGWAKRDFNIRWVAPLLTTDPTTGANVVRLPAPAPDTAGSTLR